MPFSTDRPTVCPVIFKSDPISQKRVGIDVLMVLKKMSCAIFAFKPRLMGMSSFNSGCLDFLSCIALSSMFLRLWLFLCDSDYAPVRAVDDPCIDEPFSDISVSDGLREIPCAVEGLCGAANFFGQIQNIHFSMGNVT